jgi:hypothetical protein
MGNLSDAFHVICLIGLIALAALAMFKLEPAAAKDIASHTITALASLATGVGVGMAIAGRKTGE